jgi:hypothetical protein
VKEPIRFTARAPRTRFGRIVKWSFIGFNLVMLALALGNCGLVLPYVAAEDPEVAMGAGMFAAMLAMGIWGLWPVGAVILGLATLMTRGKFLVIEQPPPPNG